VGSDGKIHNMGKSALILWLSEVLAFEFFHQSFPISAGEVHELREIYSDVEVIEVKKKTASSLMESR
jgi:hypothetical protein